MQKNIAPRSIWQNPWHFIAFGFGVGAVPYAPGTFGTLLAIPFISLIQHFSLWSYIAIVIIAVCLAVALCDVASKQIAVHDHAGMVIDEVVGFAVAMIAAPKGFWWLVLSFILFRFFDIVKPQPIKWIDKNVMGGIGAVLDDVVAGIFTVIVVQGVYWAFE